MMLPLFSYSSTIVCIDDDQLFLSTLSTLLKNIGSIKSFSSAREGVDFFNTYTPLLPTINFTQGCIDTDKYDMLNHMPVDISSAAFLDFRNNPARFSEIPVLVTDYHMPGMNGIELCRELKNLSMKKILLTGEADTELAVEAFNEGIIDVFIRKGSSTIADDIIHHTNRLTQQYFIENTQRFRSHLETDYPLPLSDSAFCQYLLEWCKQHAIREYYLIDKRGTILLMNDKGETSYLVIHTDRTLNHLLELHSDDFEAENLLNDVRLREKIPFFGENVESWELELDQWEDKFHPSTILIGSEKYYCAVVSGK